MTLTNPLLQSHISNTVSSVCCQALHRSPSAKRPQQLTIARCQALQSSFLAQQPSAAWQPIQRFKSLHGCDCRHKLGRHLRDFSCSSTLHGKIAWLESVEHSNSSSSRGNGVPLDRQASFDAILVLGGKLHPLYDDEPMLIVTCSNCLVKLGLLLHQTLLC